jgi:hypothetical protein
MGKAIKRFFDFIKSMPALSPTIWLPLLNCIRADLSS